MGQPNNYEKLKDALSIIQSECTYRKGICSACPFRASASTCAVTEVAKPRQWELITPVLLGRREKEKDNV